MVVVLAGLDELVLLDLELHVGTTGDEVVLAAVHLVLAARPRRVRHAAAEALRLLGDERVAEAFAMRAQHDHRTRVVHCTVRVHTSTSHQVASRDQYRVGAYE